jgi:hypothetical protein
LASARAAACSRAFSIIAGVRSIPVAERQTLAKTATTSPGPHATSSTLSSAPAPENSTSSLSASPSRIAAELANGVACRVNWSTTISAFEVMGPPPERRNYHISIKAPDCVR